MLSKNQGMDFLKRVFANGWTTGKVPPAPMMKRARKVPTDIFIGRFTEDLPRGKTVVKPQSAFRKRGQPAYIKAMIKEGTQSLTFKVVDGEGGFAMQTLVAREWDIDGRVLQSRR